MFITFEGIDGSGKSTQIKLLHNYFKNINKDVILTREPGGTPLAEKLREILLQNNEIKDPLTEFLILTAARRDHITKLIIPAMNNDNIVISDRFYESSVAYQGYAKGLSIEVMEQIHSLANDEIKPTITFILDIKPQESLGRISNRKNKNFYDDKSIKFHEKLREGFLQIAKKNPEYIKVIDAQQKINEIHQQIVKIITDVNRDS